VTTQLFAHGVASGDPLTDGVVIWTRLTSHEDLIPVEWTVARDRDLRDVVASGGTVAEAKRDRTIHVDVSNLEPANQYFYGFTAQGETSPIGRTRTLPGAGVKRLRFAVCSCAKYNAGFFNAYSRIADRGDLDFVLHLGDYIYEASNTPPKSQTPGADIGRPFDPLGECRTLADYRRRYAQYHRDPDVQRLHHALPMIATLDDHELADGAWSGGATEHRPDEHGPWADRRAAAGSHSPTRAAPEAVDHPVQARHRRGGGDTRATPSRRGSLSSSGTRRRARDPRPPPHGPWDSGAGWDSPVWARSLPELAMKRNLASARRAPPTDASPRFREESRDFRGGSPRGAHRPRGAR
jgi:PhoD-like phosphatase/PhoD-like phosphatase, N-terminal domain